MTDATTTPGLGDVRLYTSRLPPAEEPTPPSVLERGRTPNVCPRCCCVAVWWHVRMTYSGGVQEDCRVTCGECGYEVPADPIFDQPTGRTEGGLQQ